MSFTPLCECWSDHSCAVASDFSSFSLHRANALPFSCHPLVYFAKIPDPYNMKKRLQKNKKPNCFVKAFRWYTEEQGVNKSSTSEEQEFQFAAWLDQKYEQYLWDRRSKGAGPAGQPPTANQQVATLKSDKPKGFQRVLRSPWRRRRAAAKSPEEEPGCTERRLSWQIILSSKSMSRLPSETCALKLSAKCCASSKVTVASSDTIIWSQTYSKSQGIIVQELPEPANDFANSNMNNPNTDTTMKIFMLNLQHTRIFEEKKISSVKNSKINIKCECPDVQRSTEITKKIKCECFDVPKRTKMTGIKCECPGVSKSTASINTKCDVPEERNSDKVDASTQYDPNILIMTEERLLGNSAIRTASQSPASFGIFPEPVGQECKNQQKSAHCHMAASHFAAQTSDHAISLPTIGNTQMSGILMLMQIVETKH